MTAVCAMHISLRVCVYVLVGVCFEWWVMFSFGLAPTASAANVNSSPVHDGNSWLRLPLPLMFLAVFLFLLRPRVCLGVGVRIGLGAGLVLCFCLGRRCHGCCN